MGEDRNENNIDDTVEAIGYVAGLQHLRNQRAIRESVERQEAEQRRIASLPECPRCGGRLPRKFVDKCMHCASDVCWIEGEPCKPEDVKSRERQAEARRRAEAEQQQRERREAVARIVEADAALGG